MENSSTTELFYGYLVDDFMLVNVTFSNRFKMIIKRFKRVELRYENLHSYKLNQNHVVLIFFHILVLQEYWVLVESRIPLKPVLGAWELSHFPLVLMNGQNKSELAVFLL